MPTDEIAEQQVLSILEEPPLEFGNRQLAIDPHDGLSLFGPFSTGSSEDPGSPAHIVLGTPEGLALWNDWSDAMNKPAFLEKSKGHRLWPPYPGYQAAFGHPWTSKPVKVFELDRSDLLEASRKKDNHERCFAVVEMFLDCLEKTKKIDAKIGVAVCVVPDEVWKNCRTESRVANPTDSGISKRQKESRKSGQLELFETFDAEQYQLSPDFRRQIKARCMKFEIPIQIIRESTLRLSDEMKKGERGLTPLSDRMWNLSTGLYYKAGGKPWRLATARAGVSYVGIAFRRTENDERSACCVAQMFLSNGDGIVFLGDEGPWYSTEDKQFHLPPKSAEKLLKGVLDTYKEMGGMQPMQEIFLHCRSSISREEYEAYLKACPPGCKLVAVQVRLDKNGPRLYRVGSMPVLRGTLWKRHDRSGFLFGTGFKPRIATYDGAETPVPLRIDIQYGDASIDTVARDIFALTKLNYNACKLGEGQPVTVGFSDAVGEILLANPTVTDRKPNFKYYV